MYASTFKKIMKHIDEVTEGDSIELSVGLKSGASVSGEYSVIQTEFDSGGMIVLIEGTYVTMSSIESVTYYKS